VPLAIDADWVARIAAALPELPEAKRRRYVEALGLPEYDAGVLTSDPALAAWFEAAAAAFPQPKTSATGSWGSCCACCATPAATCATAPVPPAELAALLAAVEAGRITRALAKGAFETMFREGRVPRRHRGAGAGPARRRGRVVGAGGPVVAENPDKVAGYRGGKAKLFEFFVGQVMRASGGRANPEETRRLCAKGLDR